MATRHVGGARCTVLLLSLPLVCACGGRPAPLTPSPLATPTPSAAGPSFNMTLYAHLDLTALAQAVHADHDDGVEVEGAASGSGNWGYTSRDGRRFALTGTSVGLSIVEVTDPRRPRNIALVPGDASQWREVRTYGEYVYVTTEAKTGLDIVDMRDPDHPRKVRTWDDTFTSAHTLWIDDERGLLFANGYYDTYSGTSTGFNGAWGAYIFPGSDLILASDINGGLFVIGYTGP